VLQLRRTHAVCRESSRRSNLQVAGSTPAGDTKEPVSRSRCPLPASRVRDPREASERLPLECPHQTQVAKRPRITGCE
jgi:hypothetical protein